MRKFSYYLFLLLLISCNSTKVSNPQIPVPIGEGWKVPDKDTAKIIARLNKCGLFQKCRGSADGYKNDAEYQYLVDTYKTVSPVIARYRHADKKFYATLWGLDSKSDTAKVKGYKTIIGKVESANKNSASYYYLIKLCPPPPHCQGAFSFDSLLHSF
jgi:hypothetical protein